MNDEEKKTCVSVVFFFVSLFGVLFLQTLLMFVQWLFRGMKIKSREILASLNTIKRRKNHKR